MLGALAGGRHVRRPLSLVLLALVSGCAQPTNITPSQVDGDAPEPTTACKVASDCIAEGTCVSAPSRCVPLATYEQVHCDPEPEPVPDAPAIECGCVDGTCVMAPTESLSEKP